MLTHVFLAALALPLLLVQSGTLVYQVRTDTNDHGTLAFFGSDEDGTNATLLTTLPNVASGRASFAVVGEWLFYSNYTTSGAATVQGTTFSGKDRANAIWTSADSDSDVVSMKAYESNVYFTVSSSTGVTLYVISISDSFAVSKVLDFGTKINGYFGALEVNFGVVQYGGCDMGLAAGANGGSCKTASGAFGGTTLPSPSGPPSSSWMNSVRTPVYALTMTDAHTTYYAGVSLLSNSISIIKSAGSETTVIAKFSPAWQFSFPMSNNNRGTLFAVQDGQTLVSIDTTASPPKVTKIAGIRGSLQGVIYIDN